MNYRLGARCLDLSSLSDPDRSDRRQPVLRDLVLALEWVRDNIIVRRGRGQGRPSSARAPRARCRDLLAAPAARGLFAGRHLRKPRQRDGRGAREAPRFAAQFAEILGVDRGTPPRALMQIEPIVRQGARPLPARLIEDPRVRSRSARSPMRLSLPRIRSRRSRAARPTRSADRRQQCRRSQAVHPLAQDDADESDRDRAPARCRRSAAENASPPRTPTTASRRVMQSAPHVLRVGGVAACEAHSKHAPTYMYRYDYAQRALNWTGARRHPRDGVAHGVQPLPDPMGLAC